MNDKYENDISCGEKKIFRLYNELDYHHNKICEKCRMNNRELSNPVGAWVVGEQFYSHNKRVLFVGKNARNNPGEFYNGYQFTFWESRDYLWNTKAPYWSYTRSIASNVYADDSIENIAFTNIVKCNDSAGKDTTSKFTKKYCICELQVIRKEIEIIDPTHIIFYTSWWYDEYLPAIFDKYVVLQDKKIPIGAKMMPWCEAEGILNNKDIKLLRVGHPERMKKEDYVSAISTWIQTDI